MIPFLTLLLIHVTIFITVRPQPQVCFASVTCVKSVVWCSVVLVVCEMPTARIISIVKYNRQLFQQESFIARQSFKLCQDQGIVPQGLQKRSQPLESFGTRSRKLESYRETSSSAKYFQRTLILCPSRRLPIQNPTLTQLPTSWRDDPQINGSNDPCRQRHPTGSRALSRICNIYPVQITQYPAQVFLCRSL